MDQTLAVADTGRVRFGGCQTMAATDFLGCFDVYVSAGKVAFPPGIFLFFENF